MITGTVPVMDAGAKPKSYIAIDFWSAPQAEVQLTSVAGDKALPDIVVADVPVGAVIIRVVALMRFRVVENTFAGANGLSGAQDIQVRKVGDAYADAIALVASMFTSTVAGREGGLILEGAINLATSMIDGGATYNVQWAQGVSVANNLKFADVQVGLRVYFTT